MTRICLTVNGRRVSAEIAPRMHLADFLREEMHLTGTHIGCEHGVCGACTVEIDGEIARSCITYAVCCDGAEVRTIEGFEEDPLMARLRRAFSACHALQCGYCTPGMLVAARDLLRRKPQLSRAQIRQEMSGNLCRCTGYMGIISAIEAAMRELAGDRAEAARPVRPWLGPALGPVLGEAARLPAAATPEREPAVRRPLAASLPAPLTRARRPPIAVDVAISEEGDGTTRLTQSFVLAHPRAAVWALMVDTERLARCLPGLALVGPRQGERVRGSFEVSIGPVRARFAGEGCVEERPHEFRQIISAKGGDRASGSRISGRLEAALTPAAASDGDTATRVELAMAYVLSGPLAQIGRSSLVRDLARRIAETFAQNLEAALSDPGRRPEATRLAGGRLLLLLLGDRLRALTSILLRPWQRQS